MTSNLNKAMQNFATNKHTTALQLTGDWQPLAIFFVFNPLPLSTSTGSRDKRIISIKTTNKAKGSFEDLRKLFDVVCKYNMYKLFSNIVSNIH